ncbi:hypothetical protein FANTH_10817 [Fusarium anthophilum]|uniref:DNL-type domain-containing protein n=1 Tax=Fusarium anthophilum TaxID=48485 RepID=A0A8H4YZC6_9HYPO|nr:hypothetical protein FANTH_10817 [Fusarium anthophilum]
MRLTTFAALLCWTGICHGYSIIESEDIVHGLFKLNSARYGYGHCPLIWDSTLASYGQDYANQLGYGAAVPENLQRTAMYTETSATCTGQPHMRTFESAANFWLIAKDRPNHEQKDYHNYNVVMDPEANRIGCGQAYDYTNPCVLHTTKTFLPVMKTFPRPSPSESIEFRTMASRAPSLASKVLRQLPKQPQRFPPLLRAPFIRPATINLQSFRAAHNIPRPPTQTYAKPKPEQAQTGETPKSEGERPEIKASHYQLSFTCIPCGHRSHHNVSKQGYHYGSTLITCPECRNRHVISDHLNIFGDRKVTIEDLMREKGRLVKKGSLGEDGDIEFWPEASLPADIEAGKNESS